MHDETTLVLYDQNSNLLRIRNLKNEKTGSYIAAGVTVTADIVPAGTATPVADSAITLTYDGPNGIWSGVFPDDLVLSTTAVYECRLTIDGGSETSRGRITAPLKVRPRRKS